jgi:hypothetical protein
MVAVAAAIGFIVGSVTAGGDDGDRPAASDAEGRAVTSRQEAEVKRARERGERSGYRRGLRAGRRSERARTEERAAPATEAPIEEATPAAPAAEPQVNPDCPPGSEPTASGGCQPYDESDGQLEPKISDPRCYSDRPPDGCF